MSPSSDPPRENPAVARLQAILDSLPTPLITTDAQGRIDFLNQAAAVLLRRHPEGARGRRLEETLTLVDDQHRRLDLQTMQDRLLADGVALRVHHATLVQPAGSEVPVSCSAGPVRDAQGSTLGSAWVVHDVREERQLRDHLSHQARHDPLTGLVNRAEFRRRLERAVASAARNGDEHALCFLDLDRFKAVNDAFGHAAGDALLTDLAGLLLSRIRGRDTLARLGGDEFALLLEHCPLDEARRVADELVATVREHRFVWETEALSVGLSVGVTPIRADGPAAPLLLQAADAACYQAKALGRDRVFVVGEPG